MSSDGDGVRCVCVCQEGGGREMIDRAMRSRCGDVRGELCVCVCVYVCVCERVCVCIKCVKHTDRHT